MKKTYSVQQITFLAFALVINFVGGQIALFLQLPIYLDSMGTIFMAMAYGPIYGMLVSALSGLLLGITFDSYALYYIPSGMLLGLLMGIVWKKQKSNTWWIFFATLAVTFPTSLLSAYITAHVFGGITSSGSSYLLQLLAKTPLGLTASAFLIQLCSDYVDKWISIVWMRKVIKAMPKKFLQKQDPTRKE